MTGVSLARGPALVVGTVVTAAGLYFLYKAHTFPPFSNFTQGHAPKDGNFFFGVFGANGWTGLFTAVVGAVLLFGAAEHTLAKAFSLLCGVALGTAAIIALISGNVLGMAAANGWTEIGWGVCALILLINSLAPRRRREVVVAEGVAGADPVPATRTEPVAGTRTEPVAGTRTEPVAATRTEPVAATHEPVASPTNPATGPAAGRTVPAGSVPAERTAPPPEPPAAPPAA
ncbi:MAG: hypothetical protein ACRDNJ_14370 [Solirubrobacteraceae bacterium]